MVLSSCWGFKKNEEYHVCKHVVFKPWSVVRIAMHASISTIIHTPHNDIFPKSCKYLFSKASLLWTVHGSSWRPKTKPWYGDNTFDCLGTRSTTQYMTLQKLFPVFIFRCCIFVIVICFIFPNGSCQVNLFDQWKLGEFHR